MSLQPTLVVATDPLCGWCYGFGPALAQVRAALAERVRFRVACGGLVTGARVVPIGQTREYLLTGMAQVERRTGVRFGAGFRDGLLREGTWVSDSEPPCRAVLLAQELFGPQAALDVCAALTRSFYEAGLPPDAEATVELAARAAGVEPGPLLERYRAEADGLWTRARFAQAREEGVEQYPSLFLDRGEGLELVVEGCLDAPAALFAVERALAQS